MPVRSSSASNSPSASAAGPWLSSFSRGRSAAGKSFMVSPRWQQTRHLKSRPFQREQDVNVPQVQAGSFLTLHYRLAGPGGDIVNTFNDKPATLSLGSGELSPAIEQRLLGLEEGTRTVFELAPGEAFGERNPQMVQRLKLAVLREMGDPDEVYHVGDVVQFPTPDGQGAFAGVLRELGPVEEDWADFDFNHPLAGQPVSFEVQVIGVL